MAGGYATRLFPLTRHRAKPLLPMGGRPIIDHILDRLEGVDGIVQVVISTNKKFEGQFAEWLSQRAQGNVRVRAEPSDGKGNKLGAIRALGGLIAEMGGDDFLIIAGDNLVTSDLGDMVRLYREKKSTIIGIYDVGDIEAVKGYSAVEMDAEGRIVSFEEKPKNPRSTTIGTCIYLFPNRSANRIHEYLAEGHNPDNPGSFIGWLSEREPVYGYLLQGRWWDIGTPKSYEDAKRAT